MRVDTATLALVLAIVLLGLVMVTSASVSIASEESGRSFFYLTRQLTLTAIGGAIGACMLFVPTERVERLSMPLLVTAFGLLLLVLVPGLGHTVNGSRRWLNVAGLNFQVSELARAFILIYVARRIARHVDQRKHARGLRNLEAHARQAQPAPRAVVKL